jgi:hypothetical protein
MMKQDTALWYVRKIMALDILTTTSLFQSLSFPKYYYYTTLLLLWLMSGWFQFNERR